MSHSVQNNELYKYILRLGVVAHTCDLDTQETKADGLWVQGQPGLHSDFQLVPP